MRGLCPDTVKPLLALAVSGGSDSLALALLAGAWARDRGGSVLALIVDHGLRPGSARVAERTARRLQALGMEARILRWTGPKPRTGLQESARRARYDLLWRAVREAGASCLLTGHTLDDQGETRRLRRSRGSGAPGLAGMSARLERPDGLVLRPLLGFRRALLQDVLAARDLAWFSDPANLERRFARSALRLGPTLGLAGLRPVEALADLKAGARRRALAEHRALGLIERHAARSPWGYAALDRGWLWEDGAVTALGLLVRAYGHGGYPPPRRALAALLEALKAPDFRGSSLGGTVWREQKGRLLVHGEARGSRVPGRAHGVPARNGEQVFDRRFRLDLAGGEGCFLVRLDDGLWGTVAVQCPEGCVLPVSVRRLQPALVSSDGQVLALPTLGYASEKAPETLGWRFLGGSLSRVGAFTPAAFPVASGLCHTISTKQGS